MIVKPKWECVSFHKMQDKTFLENFILSGSKKGADSSRT